MVDSDNIRELSFNNCQPVKITTVFKLYAYKLFQYVYYLKTM